MPQWLSANARIMLALLDNMDKATITSYLRYTAKIGDYLQVSEPSSVMLLDEEHRKSVTRENRQWDDIDGDRRYFYLEKSKSSSGNVGNRRNAQRWTKRANQFASVSIALLDASAHGATTLTFAASQAARNLMPATNIMLLLVFVANKSKNSVLAAPLTQCLDKWFIELETDKDKAFLLDGIQFGFKILNEHHQQVHRVHCQNYKSATNFEVRSLVEAQIAEELNTGRYVTCHMPPTIISSLGAIPKKNGQIRLIHDCSRPHGLGVNSYATKSSFHYETVDHAVNYYRQMDSWQKLIFHKHIIVLQSTPPFVPVYWPKLAL